MSEISVFLTIAHEELRAEVRSFAETVVAPRVATMEQTKGIDRELSRLIAEQGWIGATVDDTYGGMAAGHVAKTIIIEELARVSGAMGAMAQASQLGVAKIIHFGNEQQKRRWLPRVADGTCLPTIAVTETASGGHVLGMRTTAERRDGGYVLNGHKVFVGNSHVGDLHGVVARTGEGSGGLSAFLVESERPGFSLAPYPETMGLHGFSFGELLFDDCWVPQENLLGAEGDGLSVAYSSSLLYGRANLTAVSLGIHEAIVARTLAYAKERILYGKPLAALPTVKQKLGEMQSKLMVARLTAYHAVHLLDHGFRCDADLMNAKVVNVEAAMDSGRLAMEIFAAAGLIAANDLERLVRDAFHIYAPAGTSDIQRLRLAEVALGKDHEDWAVRLAPELRVQGRQLLDAAS